MAARGLSATPDVEACHVDRVPQLAASHGTPRERRRSQAGLISPGACTEDSCFESADNATGT